MLNDVDQGPLHSRLHKTCCCDGCCCIACNCLFHICRKTVSGNKNRYEKDGFDLDLVYLTPRIIVHAFPAMGLEHIYRNPRHEIKRFMDLKHPNDYKMYNFCCEPGRGYNADFFHGRVERYPFKDHNTPPLETIIAFANSAKKWLDENPAHVVNMHCKAGKGRAGLMSCILLIRTGEVQSADEALDLYDKLRVSDKKGLTVTSQRKYVRFYEYLWRKHWKVHDNIGNYPADLEKTWAIPEQPKIPLYGVEVSNVLNMRCIRIQVFKGTNSKPILLAKSDIIRATDGSTSLRFTDFHCILEGNFKVQVDVKSGFFGGYKKAFEMWHNTLFMETIEDDMQDFKFNHIDIGKKMQKKHGRSMVLRLIFKKSSELNIAPTK